MFIFYSQNIKNSSIIIAGDDYKHITRSLRKKVGDTLFITDGQGALYEVVIDSIEKKTIKTIIQKTTQSIKKERLHIAIGVTKIPSRIEMFVEKATEIGIHEISFLEYKHSEKAKVKMDRLTKIAISAMKQSSQTFLPILHDVQKVEDFIANQSPEFRFFGHMEKDILSFGEATKGIQEASILIGPEGHFSNQEIELFKSHDWKPVTLGKTRLRVETAGIVAASIFLS